MVAAMTDEILAANRRFYEAFSSADLGAMDEIWARDAPVSCVHPGWAALVEREEIMLSWQAILAGEAPAEIDFDAAEAFPGEDMAYVVCTETIGETQLVATNVFVREAGDWKLAHHHVGPVVRRARAGDKRPGPAMPN
jgi:ketosteroid isomerase-like protein